MKKNIFLGFREVILVIAVLFVQAGCSSKSAPTRILSAQNHGTGGAAIVLNPYKSVDWKKFKQYKAALHVHTLQSDGQNSVDSVVRSFKKDGFSILALSDHDKMEPNAQFARGRMDWSLFDKIATPFPKDPKPENYPFNTTWPWNEYGGPTPREIGMIGIEAAEISYRHHMNSLYSDYGTGYTATSEKEILTELQKKGGYVFFNHPADPAPFSKGGRKSLEWYIEHFQSFPSDFLIGIDVANEWEGTLSLWDQLLAHFMPSRPIWGFCTSDMHRLPKDHKEWPHTIFVLEELTDSSVRQKMKEGQFYSTRSNKGNAGLYPTIDRIDVDSIAGSITIQASDYDTIRWISSPPSSELLGDLNTSKMPWPPGRVVHEGKTLNYRTTAGIKNYVRAEILRTVDGKVYRTFTNPFGMSGEK